MVGKKAEKSCFLKFVSRSESECRSGVQVSSVAVPGCWDSSWAGTGLDVADCCAFSKMNLLVSLISCHCHVEIAVLSFGLWSE